MTYATLLHFLQLQCNVIVIVIIIIDSITKHKVDSPVLILTWYFLSKLQTTYTRELLLKGVSKSKTVVTSEIKLK